LIDCHRKRQLQDRLRVGEGWTETGYVFVDQLGGPYSPELLSNFFEWLVKTSGLLRIRLHDTRHAAARLMLASGVSVKVVQEMLGHSLRHARCPIRFTVFEQGVVETFVDSGMLRWGTKKVVARSCRRHSKLSSE